MFFSARRNQNHPKHLVCRCLLYDRQNLSQGRTFPLLLDPLRTFRVCHRICSVRCRRKRVLINCTGADIKLTSRKFRSSVLALWQCSSGFEIGDILPHTTPSYNFSIDEVLFNCLNAYRFFILGMTFSKVPWRGIG